MGRPLKLDAAVRERIVQQLVSGCTLEVAATSAGVARRSLVGWLAAGRALELELNEAGTRRLTASESQYLELVQAEQVARATAELGALASFGRRRGRTGRRQPGGSAQSRPRLGRPGSSLALSAGNDITLLRVRSATDTQLPD